MHIPTTKINRCVGFLLLLGVLSSCASFRSAPGAGSRWEADEYRPYERKLGIRLSGNENPELIREVSSWMGVPYRYGGNTRTGADCSGFVWSVYRKVYGISLPRTTTEMARQTRRIRLRNLQEGDLVFFSSRRRKPAHVGIYLGNDQFIHASTSRGVMVSGLDESYYRRRFVGGGRPQ